MKQIGAFTQYDIPQSKITNRRQYLLQEIIEAMGGVKKKKLFAIRMSVYDEEMLKDILGKRKEKDSQEAYAKYVWWLTK